MVWYVNTKGPITSVNACPQIGFAEREVNDDDHELLKFRKKIQNAFEAKTNTENQPTEEP